MEFGFEPGGYLSGIHQKKQCRPSTRIYCRLLIPLQSLGSVTRDLHSEYEFHQT